MLQSRRGVKPAELCDALGVPVVEGAYLSRNGQLKLIGTGPDAWFLVLEKPAEGWLEAIEACVAGLAAVVDQSAGYAVQRISGPKARTLLQAGIPLDLHPSAFETDRAFSTVLAHIGVLLWQEGDGVFDLAYYRSYSASLEHWLGVTVRTV
nr:sarcosine oxidase subunit gamma family protein [Sphingobium sp. JAI105]